LFLLAITGVFFSGCPASNNPDKLAERFVDAYYIEYDLDRALTMADGSAKARLIDEKGLVDAARQKVELAQSKTHVYYSAPERRELDPDLVYYTFGLEVRQGSSDMRRTAMVMLGQRGGAWRVIGFREPGDRWVDEASTGGREAMGVRSSTQAPRRETESPGHPMTTRGTP
jgi:hypothetical protein